MRDPACDGVIVLVIERDARISSALEGPSVKAVGANPRIARIQLEKAPAGRRVFVRRITPPFQGSSNNASHASRGFASPATTRRPSRAKTQTRAPQSKTLPFLNWTLIGSRRRACWRPNDRHVPTSKARPKARRQMHRGPQVPSKAAGHLPQLRHPRDRLFQPAGREIHPLPAVRLAKQGNAIRIRWRHFWVFGRTERATAGF
jgi:hypothetical protein